MSLHAGIECTFQSLQSGETFTLALSVTWRIAGENLIRDRLGPGASAGDLFDAWLAWVGGPFPHGRVPVSWYVEGPTLEGLPGDPLSEGADFLARYTQPVRVDSGQPLDWHDLPVQERSSGFGPEAGSFISEVAGWSPKRGQGTVKAAVLRRSANSAKVAL